MYVSCGQSHVLVGQVDHPNNNNNILLRDVGYMV